MKAIMYHYVRPAADSLPYFRYLKTEDFTKQLEWFERNDGIISKQRFFECLALGRTAPGIVLTFDDAISDHFEHVSGLLKSRGLWAIFYIPTAIFDSPKILDVHRIHLILGRHGGAHALSMLKKFISDYMLSDRDIDAFQRATYVVQSNDAATTLFKQTLNYFVSYEYREVLLDQLMIESFGSGGEAQLRKDFYLTHKQLQSMHETGMLIGSHGVNHLVMSKLSVEMQEYEISHSFGVLSDILGTKTETFCYPYGGFHTFSSDTERLLARHGCRFSFNVEARDIADSDFGDRAQALPRYDCNVFPHGVANLGPTLPSTSAEA